MRSVLNDDIAWEKFLELQMPIFGLFSADFFKIFNSNPPFSRVKLLDLKISRTLSLPYLESRKTVIQGIALSLSTHVCNSLTMFP